MLIFLNRPLALSGNCKAEVQKGLAASLPRRPFLPALGNRNLMPKRKAQKHTRQRLKVKDDAGGDAQIILILRTQSQLVETRE
jgi:hypothetical protein